MRIFDIIDKKKKAMNLSEQEINYVVEGFCGGEFGDGPMAALLMAICLNGLSREETAWLTMAMVHSGEIMDLSVFTKSSGSSEPRALADKHSTGGVGDKLTLIVGPMVAAEGVAMVKMSGKALGHTGGTIDKLESIPGLSTGLTPMQVKDIVEKVGISISAQSLNLAPADKKIYALRDATATVDSIPLIAASIMSKKIAAGADSILLDVKVGSGAFMKTLDAARELAQIMVNIGKDCGRNMAAVLTCMDAPLGRAVGNGLEVAEAVDVLRGGGPCDIKELSIELAAGILSMAKSLPLDKARELAAATLADGRAFNKFVQMAAAQGGDVSYLHNPSLFMSATVTALVSPQAGYVASMNGELCGTASHILGHCPLGMFDTAAGVIFHKKIGDYVEKGETLADLHSDIPEAIQEALEMLTNAYGFSDTKPQIGPLVLETM